MAEESCEMQLCGFGNTRVLKRPTLDCTRAGGEGESPSRKEWLARHEVLVSVVGVHFRPPRGMQILTTCCPSLRPPPSFVYSFFPFLSFSCTLESWPVGKVITVIARSRFYDHLHRGKSHGKISRTLRYVNPHRGRFDRFQEQLLHATYCVLQIFL